MGAAGLIFTLGCPKEEAPPDYELQARYQKAAQALAENRLPEAEKRFRQLLQESPKHGGGMCGLAGTLRRKAEKLPAAERTEALAEADRLLRRAIELDPESQTALHEQALVLMDLGRLAEADGAYQKLIQRDPKDLDSIVARARIAEARQDPAQAETILREAVSSHPRSAILELELGRLLLRLSRPEEARAVFSSIGDDLRAYTSRIRPIEAYFEILDELGQLAVRSGRLDEARAVYQKLTEVEPQDFMAWEVLAALDESEKKWAEAEKKYRRSLDIDRAHVSGWRGLARCLLAQGKREDARYAWQRADGLVVQSPEQAVELSQELEAFGDRAWARTVLEKARLVLSGNAEAVAAIDARLRALSATPDGGTETDR
jgi:tetratricopeptide (TPR) repeat protein